MSDDELHTDHDLIMQLIGAQVHMAAVLAHALEDAGIMSQEQFANSLHSEDNVLLRGMAKALAPAKPGLSVIEGGAGRGEQTPSDQPPRPRKP